MEMTSSDIRRHIVVGHAVPADLPVVVPAPQLRLLHAGWHESEGVWDHEHEKEGTT